MDGKNWLAGSYSWDALSLGRFISLLRQRAEPKAAVGRGGALPFLVIAIVINPYAHDDDPSSSCDCVVVLVKT